LNQATESLLDLFLRIPDHLYVRFPTLKMSHGQTVPAISPPRSIGNGFAIADVRKPTTYHPAHSRSPSYWDSILAINPKHFENDPEKLAGWFVVLQTKCKEQRAELAKFHQEELDRSQTAGSSRTPTQESDSSTKKPIPKQIPQDTRSGVAIVFNPSNNKVKVEQRRDMKGTHHCL
jgi:hypothetical protein